jgi:7-carboxy-7-deazaguanine synthase
MEQGVEQKTRRKQEKSMTSAPRTVMVSECFGPTVQGEGALIGKPTVFVRTGGCDNRCSWCDSLYAVLPEYKSEWTPMTAEQIMLEVRRLSGDKPILVTLSGGNPALQPLEELIALGHTQGYTFALETQGSVAQPWFAKLDYLTLSPKPPSSKQATRWERLDRCISYAQNKQGEMETQICLKIVIFDDTDFAYARYVASRYPTLPLYLQAGNHTPPHIAQEIDIPGIVARLDWLIGRVTAEQWYSAIVLPQLHTLLWGNKRGV